MGPGRQRVTSEGEVDPLHQFEMSVGSDNCDDRIFLVWPMNICHVIDKTSPLFEYSAKVLRPSPAADGPDEP